MQVGDSMGSQCFNLQIPGELVFWVSAVILTWIMAKILDFVRPKLRRDHAQVKSHRLEGLSNFGIAVIIAAMLSFTLWLFFLQIGPTRCGKQRGFYRRDEFGS
ncbi:hypothetical protein ANRL4_03543 [Anaerolineae bacterium]|nr:hypothetical protein ANRL4_03543 [Anaerolineae bacterium]